MKIGSTDKEEVETEIEIFKGMSSDEIADYVAERLSEITGDEFIVVEEDGFRVVTEKKGEKL